MSEEGVPDIVIEPETTCCSSASSNIRVAVEKPRPVENFEEQAELPSENSSQDHHEDQKDAAKDASSTSSAVISVCVEEPEKIPPFSSSKNGSGETQKEEEEETKILSTNSTKEMSPERLQSPPASEKCPICLAEPLNSSCTDTCRHKFCFVCLLEWSKIKAICPLCKQAFKSIIYNIRSEEEYDLYELPPPNPESGTPRPPRFRYPTTMTNERLAILQRVRELQTRILEENMTSRRGLSFATQSWHAPVGGQNTGTPWLERARMALEACRRSRQGAKHYRDLRRYRRLFLASENVPREELIGSPDFRRLIYERGLRVRPLEDIPDPGLRDTRVRDTNPEFFRENPAMIHRLIPWLTRELAVLLQDNVHNIQSVTNLIVSLLNRYEIRSEQFERRLSPALLQNTNHFLHEFYHFARSPCETLQEYDRRCFYDSGNTPYPPPELVDLDQEPDSAREASSSNVPDMVGGTSAAAAAASVAVGSGNDDVIEIASTSRTAFANTLHEQISRIQDQLERIRNMIRVGPDRSNIQSPNAMSPQPLRWEREPIVVDLTRENSEENVAGENAEVVIEEVDGERTASVFPSCRWDLEKEEEEEEDPDVPGPSGISAGNPAEVEKREDSDDSDLEIVCEMKPRHLRTPPLINVEDNNDQEVEEDGQDVDGSGANLNLGEGKMEVKEEKKAGRMRSIVVTARALLKGGLDRSMSGSGERKRRRRSYSSSEEGRRSRRHRHKEKRHREHRHKTRAEEEME